MRAFVVITAFLLTCSADASPHWDDFSVYCPHTRWIDQQTHSITIDAFYDRLVISERGHYPLTIYGRWRGRSFWRPPDERGEVPYFALANGDNEASFFKEPKLKAGLKRCNFWRIRPDPKT